MRELSDIAGRKGLRILTHNEKEGIEGYYELLEHHETIKFGTRYYFVFTWNNGWEHLSISVAGSKRNPTWDEMCMFKDIFFKEDEPCVEYHPRKEDYINLHPYCLHIWRPLESELPIPDKKLVF